MLFFSGVPSTFLFQTLLPFIFFLNNIYFSRFIQLINLIRKVTTLKAYFFITYYNIFKVTRELIYFS